MRHLPVVIHCGGAKSFLLLNGCVGVTSGSIKAISWRVASAWL